MDYAVAGQSDLGKIVSLDPKERIKKLHYFNQLLNIPPDEQYVKPIPFAPANSNGEKPKHLEIGYVLFLLDTFFMGDWSTCNFKWELKQNTFVGSLDLVYFHPILGKYITRSGIAGKDAKLLETGHIKSKQLEGAPGNVKSVALRNAAKDIGVAFGRNLNRKFKSNYIQHGGFDELF